MSTARPGHRDVARRRLVLAVGLALFGLLSMHGWGVHVGDHAGEPMTAVAMGDAMAAPPTGPSASAHADHHAPGGVDRTAAAADDPHRAGGPGHDMGLVGMCLTVLAAAVLTLVALVLLRTRRPASRHGDGVLAATIRALARDPDPPDIHRLCVLRC